MAKAHQPISDDRRRAIIAAYQRNGGNIAAAARETDVAIRTAHRWIKRYRQDGEHGLEPRSHARKTPNKRIDHDVIARVWAVHQQFPALTYQQISTRLAKEGVTVSKSSVHRIVQQRARVAAAANTPRIIFPTIDVSVTLERRLQEASFLLDRAQWSEADALALAASTRETKGGERWAKIVLTYCPLARQQAGDAAGAEEIIAYVERTCQEANDHPPSLSPPVQALIENRRAWIHDGLLGDFDHAAREFAASKRLAREAGDARLMHECGHFTTRTFVEFAMTSARAWLTARPMRALSAGLTRALNTELTSPKWNALKQDGNPHNYRFEFNMLAMLHPDRAAKLLDDRGSPLATAPVLHMLSSARWHASDRDWDRAIAAAQDASREYCVLRHPLGIAHATAIAAYALRRRGIRTRADMVACLDAWICALRLHPFNTHPLYQAARTGLTATLRDMRREHADWLAQYEIDLSDRMWERRDAYHVFDCTDAALGPVPSFSALLNPG